MSAVLPFRHRDRVARLTYTSQDGWFVTTSSGPAPRGKVFYKLLHASGYLDLLASQGYRVEISGEAEKAAKAEGWLQ